MMELCRMTLEMLSMGAKLRLRIEGRSLILNYPILISLPSTTSIIPRTDHGADGASKVVVLVSSTDHAIVNTIYP